MSRRTRLLVRGSSRRVHVRAVFRVLELGRRAVGSELRPRCRRSGSLLLADVRLVAGAAQELPLRRWAPRSVDLSLLVAVRLLLLLLLLLLAGRLMGRGRSGPIAGDAPGRVQLRRLLILRRARARADARRRAPSCSRR